MNFNIAGIPVELEYRKIKTLRLTVYPPDGRVKISAPAGTDTEYIRKFISSKAGWIEKHREKFLARSKTNGALRNNSTVYVWGVPLKLEIVERGGNPKIVIENGSFTMYIRPLSPGSKTEELLDKWYRNALKEAAPPVIEKWEKLLGLEVKKLFVRKMKSHWGSCNYARQTLRLNSELVKWKPECLEYVIVHEMIHIIERSHNHNFYRLMNRYFPGWKLIRRQMNSGGK